MNWEHLFQTARKTFYTEFLDELGSLLVIIIYFFNKKRKGPQLLLVIIAIAGFSQLLVYHYCMLSLDIAKRRCITHFSIYAYITIETICCLLYLKKYIKSASANKLIVSNIVFFIVFMTIVVSSPPHIFAYYIEIIEGFLIITFCLYFFYELFTQKTNRMLFIEPSHWAISGMLLLFCLLMPLYVFLNFVSNINESIRLSLFTINYIAYALFYTMLSIAILYMGRGEQ